MSRHEMPAITALTIWPGYTWVVEIVSSIAWAGRSIIMGSPGAMAGNGDRGASLAHCEDEDWRG